MTEATDTRIVAHAVWFAYERMKTFEKDFLICLREDERGRHAYMPALLACTSMIELFSCLCKGDLEAKGDQRIIDYKNRFMDSREYTDQKIKVFWRVFRHKVAHISKPSGTIHVKELDSKGDNSILTWTITEYNQRPSIDIQNEVGAISAERKPPWLSGSYTHRCFIHLPSLAKDIMESVMGPKGYIQAVREDKELQKSFKTCMDQFFEK